MATTVQSIVTQVRRHLRESAEVFWSDDELVDIVNRGIRDLFRAINDNYQNYFVTVDASSVTHPASSDELSGVPADVGIVRGIEPADLGTYNALFYKPKDYNHFDFQTARSQSQTMDPAQGATIWYAVMQAGAPVGAPTIKVAPQLSSAVTLRLTYVPALADVVLADNNPIPGESDQALINWTVAYARAKEKPDSLPDAGWLQLYATEKQSILISLTPRQTDEEDLAEAIFEDLW